MLQQHASKQIWLQLRKLRFKGERAERSAFIQTSYIEYQQKLVKQSRRRAARARQRQLDL